MAVNAGGERFARGETVKIETKVALALIFVSILGVRCFVARGAKADAKAHEKSSPKLAQPRTVERVDLARYAGRWFEIASFPQVFSDGCVATQADYTLRKDGTVGVRNSCRQFRFDGRQIVAKARAKTVENSGDSRLKVRFFGVISGDYWILALGESYDYALVGDPKRRSLFVLSRSRQMNGAIYERLVAVARENGFDVAKLRRTPQPLPHEVGLLKKSASARH